MTRPNIHDPVFDEPRRSVPGFHAQRARIGRRTGMQRLGMSLWEIEPGEAAYPYHFHLGEEEALVVLEGTPTLRTPAGNETLRSGDVVSLPAGEENAHQIINDSGAVVRFLAVSTNGAADVIIYPDEGKIGAAERRPGADPGFSKLFLAADEVGYDHGIEPRR